MGNDNFLYISFDRIVQDRRESPSFKVEAASIIFNDFVIRVLTLEELLLTFKVRFLTSCTDPAIADFSSGRFELTCAGEAADNA